MVDATSLKIDHKNNVIKCGVKPNLSISEHPLTTPLNKQDLNVRALLTNSAVSPVPYGSDRNVIAKIARIDISKKMSLFFRELLKLVFILFMLPSQMWALSGSNRRPTD